MMIKYGFYNFWYFKKSSLIKYKDRDSKMAYLYYFILNISTCFFNFYTLLAMVLRENSYNDYKYDLSF